MATYKITGQVGSVDGGHLATRRGAALARKWSDYPGLRRPRPDAAAGRGKLQVAIRRAFVIGNGITTSSAVYDFAFGRRPVRRRSFGNRRWIWIYLMRIADPIGRAKTNGHPTIWRLKPDLKL